MSWVKGRMRKCDKCGKTVFENIKEDGIFEFNKENGREMYPVATYQETIGWENQFGNLDLCPECAEKSHKVTYTFRCGVEE